MTDERRFTEFELRSMNEVWVENNEDFVFDHTKIVLLQNNEFFSAATTERLLHHRENPDCSKLDYVVLIPREDYCPRYKPHLTKAPARLPSNTYIKRPSLLPWDRNTPDSNIAGLVLHEAEICEILRKNPHPNIVAYHGCQVVDGRVVGLCLTRYDATLAERLATTTVIPIQSWYEGMKRGVDHLHHIGLVHNDFNPSNIMFDGDTPVIIDFDSCKQIGEELGDKAGTHGWDLEHANIALPENDTFGLRRIKDTLLSKIEAQKEKI